MSAPWYRNAEQYGKRTVKKGRLREQAAQSLGGNAKRGQRQREALPHRDNVRCAAQMARGFKSRREAKDWCASHYPGSPIHEIGADSSKRISRAIPRKGPLLARGGRKIKNPAESGGVL